MQIPSQNNNVRTSMFYVNDIHGQLPKMERIASAALQFDSRPDKTQCDSFKLASGDLFIGSDDKRNEAVTRFLEVVNFDAKTLGNHPFDSVASKVADRIKRLKTKVLCMNLNFPKNSRLADSVMRSAIIDKNGHKYGFIGIQPVDLNSRLKNPQSLEGIVVDNKQQTFKELQQEVNKLRQQGVNKITLLSHAGNDVEKEITQNVEGIDVILGGHSHDLIEGVREGENLFYSKTGEPVIITQAGRDGEHFGVLNLEYNPNGVITKVQNSIYDTNKFSTNQLVSSNDNAVLGFAEKIGILTNQQKSKDITLEENPLSDFVSDAVKNELNADIVLINGANCRGSLPTGAITTRDVSSIFPFKNRLNRVALSEAQLVDTLKFCAKSISNEDNKPGLMQGAGFEYEVSSDGQLLSLSIKDKNGKLTPVDINHPDKTKTYNAILDDFLLGGGDDLTFLKNTPVIEQFDFDKDKPTIDYIKKLNGKPFELKTDGRIKIQSHK